VRRNCGYSQHRYRCRYCPGNVVLRRIADSLQPGVYRFWFRSTANGVALQSAMLVGETCRGVGARAMPDPTRSRPTRRQSRNPSFLDPDHQIAVDSLDGKLRQAHAPRADHTPRAQVKAQAMRRALQDVAVKSATRERCAVVRA
jgi:hypothetical protein